MRGFKMFVSLLFVVSLLSCRNTVSRSVSAFKNASGLPFETLLVVDEVALGESLVDSLKLRLMQDYPSLPQREPSTKLMVCSEDEFEGLMRYVRNIVVVDVNPDIYTKVSVVKEKDCWAKGQLVLRLQSPSLEELRKGVAENGNVLLQEIIKEERVRYSSFLKENYSFLGDSLVKSSFGISICMPEEMCAYRKDSSFLWISNDASSGRMDIAVYRLASLGENEKVSTENLVCLRDSVMKRNIPGGLPGSYMQTENKYLPVVMDEIEVDGKECISMRGLWKMHGDKMGGPFVCYIMKDLKGEGYIAVEGFVYSPDTNKKIYIHRLESALNTIKCEL